MLSIESTAASLNRHAVLYKKEINQRLRQDLEWEKMFSARACDHTYSAPNATATEVLQPYQPEFTPKGNVNFDAVENELQRIKIDIEITGDDLETFWDSWMVEWFEIGKDPQTFSLPAYVFEQVYFKQAIEELNTNGWSGVYAAPITGTPGASINAVDGYKTKIEAAIAAGDLTEYATGPLVEATMVNQIETWNDSLPAPYRNAAGNIYMATSNATKYYRNYRSEFGAGKGTDNNNNVELRIDATKKKIVGIDSMEGSNRIFFSPTGLDNVIWGTRRGFPTYPTVRFQYIDRKIKMLGEFYRFYGFEFWEHLFTNDQA